MRSCGKTGTRPSLPSFSTRPRYLLPGSVRREPTSRRAEEPRPAPAVQAKTPGVTRKAAYIGPGQLTEGFTFHLGNGLDAFSVDPPL